MATTSPATTSPEVDDDTPRVDLVLPARHRHRGKHIAIEHKFVAYARTDGGSVLNLVGGRNEQQAASALQAFLFRCLVDDDGVSYEAIPRLLTPGEVTADAEPTKASTSTEVELVDDDAKWRLVWPNEDGTPTSEPAVENVFDTLDAAQTHAREQGSSLRRFTALMSEPLVTVELNDLTEMTRTVASESAGRPTQPSKPSRGSRRTKAQ